MADTALDVVSGLAADGATHFHASYVGKQLGISAADAHTELAKLREEGLVDAHVEILCPECDRTLRIYDLGQELPLGETLEDDSCDGEPFEVGEDDLFMTYSPSKKLLIDVNRTARSTRAKKKRWIRSRLRAIWSMLRRLSISTKRDARSTSTSLGAPEHQSGLEARGLITR